MDILHFWHIFGILLLHGNVNSALTDDKIDNSTSPGDSEYVVVSIASGKIRGKVINAVGKEGKVLEFLGIPYAEKPIDDLRFMDPLPKESWEGTIDALQYGRPCIQQTGVFVKGFPDIEMWSPLIPINEDCLSLNIWSPHPSPKNATVMVWIYGGGFTSGTSSLGAYYGGILARHTDVIVVSFNYRIGAFGFLASGDYRIKGNFGLKDQVLALQWVKDNIAYFGGNPNSVTIFGESAGASSVGYHLMSPLSSSLFQKVIMQSGTTGASYSFHSMHDAKSRFKSLLSYVNCPNDDNVMSCLRNVPADKLNKYTSEIRMTNRLAFPFMPVIDGHFLKEDPNYLIDKYNLKKIPMLFSVNRNEGFLFLYRYPKSFHIDNESCIGRNVFSEIVDDFYKDLSPNTLEFIKYLYTDWTDSDSPIKNRDALDAIIGDREFVCPMHNLAEKARAYNPDVYLAEFNYRTPVDVGPEWMGAYHGAELQFLFGHPFNKSRGYTDKDRIISQQIMTYWSNFAKFGNPNGDTSQGSSRSNVNLTWPALHHEHQHLEITDELKIGNHFKDDKCQFWNEVLPRLTHLSCSTN